MKTKSFFKGLLLLGLGLALLASLGGVLLWQEIGSHPELSISINGETLPLHELHATHWAGLLFGAVVTGLVLAVVLPLSLLLGLGLPLLMLAGMAALVLAAALGVGALLGSPLILLALLLWLLLRKPRAPYKPQDRSGAATPQ